MNPTQHGNRAESPHRPTWWSLQNSVHDLKEEITHHEKTLIAVKQSLGCLLTPAMGHFTAL